MENPSENLIKEVLNPENIQIIWDYKTSQKELVPLKSDLPIRNVLNKKGTRNLEIILNSKYGFFTKTLALIEDTDILIPKEFSRFTQKIDFGGFKEYGLKREIDLLIGAFSLETMFLSINQEDVNSYHANGIEYELVKAYDGSIQCFEISKQSKNLGMFDPISRMNSTEFDGKPLSSYQITNQGLSVFPTNYTHTWVNRLESQRLLQSYNMLK